MNIKPKRNFRIIVSIVIIAALALLTFFYALHKNNRPTINHSPCLEDGEFATSSFDYNRNIGQDASKFPVTVFVGDLFTETEKYRFQIENVEDNAYPIEIRKCGVYVIREFNYDQDGAKQAVDYREKPWKKELWKYDYRGKGEKIILFFEKQDEFIGHYSSFFLTSTNEKYIALIKGWYGEPEEHAVVIKNMETLEDVHTITLSELTEKYGIEQGTLTLSGSNNGVLLFEVLNYENSWFRLYLDSGEMERTS